MSLMSFCTWRVTERVILFSTAFCVMVELTVKLLVQPLGLSQEVVALQATPQEDHRSDPNIGAPRKVLRILVLCLQSSGCTLFMKLLGQQSHTASFMDVGVFVPPDQFPEPADFQIDGVAFVALKATIQGDEIVDPKVRLQAIKNRFQPHKTILWLRDPACNYGHLLQHKNPKVEFDTVCADRPDGKYGYGGRCGSPEGKLRALELLYISRQRFFDAVLYYEDLLVPRRRGKIISTMIKMGFPLVDRHFQMHVGNFEIIRFARKALIGKQFHWGAGDVKNGPIVADGEKSSGYAARFQSRVEIICPTVTVESRLRNSLAEMPPHNHSVSQESFISHKELLWHARRHIGDFLIVSFVNDAYRAVLVNWMASMFRLKIDNYMIVCLDDPSRTFMTNIGRPCLHRTVRGRKHIWLFRMRTLMMLLNHNIHVLLSDLDAVWLRNPGPLLNGGDIVASRGTFPAPVAKKLGATVCMGFVYFRAVDLVRRFVAHVLEKANSNSTSIDDQKAFNEALVEHHVAFSKMLTPLGGETDYGKVSVNGSSFLLAVLDTWRFPRACPNDEVIFRAYVAHCFQTKGNVHPRLWLLDNNWEERIIAHNFSRTMERILMHARLT